MILSEFSSKAATNFEAITMRKVKLGIKQASQNGPISVSS